MSRLTWFAIGLATAGLVGVAVAGSVQRRMITDDDETEPSPCIADATIQVDVNPATVAYGQTSVVSWAVDIPPGCSGVHVQLNRTPVAAMGSRTISPAAPFIYPVRISMTRLGVYQEKSAFANVHVTYPARVIIDPGTPSPVAVLLGALASSNPRQVIELCDVDLDLTGHKNIVIGDGRSLIASPPCARGPRHFGPRIFVRDGRGRQPLFTVRGDSVLISGFRLEGPTSGIASGDNKEKGILIAPFSSPAPIRSVEISNMEIFHWAGLGVQVTDNVEQAERGRLFNTNEAAVRIIDNFFHHNRHTQEGYGVEVSAGGYALIARNVFDENRHGIAGGSKNKNNGLDYSGYTARDNLILSEGGLACSHGFWARLTAPDEWFRHRCWRTHQIDMHGDENKFYSGSNWQCGTAGETMIIQRNTILYTKSKAIKIRGNPADKAVVDGNVFKHGGRGDAIAQNGFCGWGDNITNPIDVRPNNVFGVDPRTKLGSCDFVGDGLLDKFMATGVTWWARSPTTSHWRYLNTMPERLPQLSLVRVDGDNVCDVTPKRRQHDMHETLPRTYSRSGTGPWRPVAVLHS